MSSKHPREVVAMIAARLLDSKFGSGQLPVPGSPAIRESVVLAHALLDDVDAYEVDLEKAEAAAAEKKKLDERLAAEKAEADAKAAAEAEAAQKEHDRLEKLSPEERAAEKKKNAGAVTAPA